MDNIFYYSILLFRIHEGNGKGYQPVVNVPARDSRVFSIPELRAVQAKVLPGGCHLNMLG